MYRFGKYVQAIKLINTISFCLPVSSHKVLKPFARRHPNNIIILFFGRLVGCVCCCLYLFRDGIIHSANSLKRISRLLTMILIHSLERILSLHYKPHISMDETERNEHSGNVGFLFSRYAHFEVFVLICSGIGVECNWFWLCLQIEGFVVWKRKNMNHFTSHTRSLTLE